MTVLDGEMTGPAHTDVLIAGGGPAGLACAIALACKGLRVIVADGMTPPIDKACGEGLMPDTLAALRELGIDPAASPQHAIIAGIAFIDSATGTTAQARFPSRPGHGMTRLHLHRLLLDRATDLGVRFLWQTTVRSCSGPIFRKSVRSSQANQDRRLGQYQEIETTRGSIRARFLIGADGHQSLIRARANLDRGTVTSSRIGLRQHFTISPWTDLVEVHWSNHGQAYVTPVSADQVCVAFVSSTKFCGGVSEALCHFPQLHARLAGALLTSPSRGSATYSRKLHGVTSGNIALVGDASGSVDAVTGEGLSLCFRQALALAAAIDRNDLAIYQRAHTALRRLPQLMASTMLFMDSSPVLRSCAIASLRALPSLFKALLAVHVGESPMRLGGKPASAQLIATGSPRLRALPDPVSQCCTLEIDQSLGKPAAHGR